MFEMEDKHRSREYVVRFPKKLVTAISKHLDTSEEGFNEFIIIACRKRLKRLQTKGKPADGLTSNIGDTPIVECTQ